MILSRYLSGQVPFTLLFRFCLVFLFLFQDMLCPTLNECVVEYYVVIDDEPSKL